MPYADDLISQARALARADATRPQQANLRRAVSAAYYAVFYELCHQAVRSVLSKSEAGDAVGARLARVVTHRAVAIASKWFAEGVTNKVIQGLRQNSPLAPSMKSLCRIIIVLQDERHRADYDQSLPFSRNEALRLIDDAEEALRVMRASSSDSDMKILFLGVLFGDSLIRNT